jgi:hypothetical protein
MAACETDFLRGFAQCSVDAIRVLRLGAAAGEADLTSVVGEMIGTLRKEEGRPRRAIHHRHQHSRRDRVASRGLHALEYVTVKSGYGTVSHSEA